MSNAKQKKKNKMIAIFIVIILVATSMTTIFGLLAAMVQ